MKCNKILKITNFVLSDTLKGKDKISHNPPYKIPEEYILPSIGRLHQPLRIADNTTKFKQFETIETTEYFCENRMKEVECEVVCLPDRPVLNAIQVGFYVSMINKIELL